MAAGRLDMVTRRRFITTSAAGVASFALPRRAQSEIVGKLTRVIVGFAPGGSSDVVARLIVDRMKGYASTIVVDNRPGAGGRIALEIVKASPADGSVMVLSPASMMVLYPHLHKPLGYDPEQDFIAVSTVCAFPFVISVGPMVPREVKTLDGFIRWCKANPKLASYGTSGAGSMLHFAGMMLARAASFEFTHVPYKGASPALQDLLGGQVASTVGVLGIALPHIQSGHLRALATSGTTRTAFLPDVPTLKEAGYPGLEITEWQGIFLPAKTPPQIVDGLNRSVRMALETNEVKEGLNKLSFEIGGTSLEEFARLVKADIGRWAPIVKESGFTPEN
jgi:tripartite-type tricarboxylate transporter receptor subunit TctC